MIDMHQPLAVLTSCIPWQQIEACVSHLFLRCAKAGEALPELDLFGEQVARLAKASNGGRPRVPLRATIAPLYLKHAFNLSDEAAVERLGFKAGRCAHTRKFRRMRAVIKRQRTVLARLVRELGRQEVAEHTTAKLCAAHQVLCASSTSVDTHNPIVCANAFAGNPLAAAHDHREGGGLLVVARFAPALGCAWRCLQDANQARSPPFGLAQRLASTVVGLSLNKSGTTKHSIGWCMTF